MTSTQAAQPAPTRYRVTAAYLTCRAGDAGFLATHRRGYLSLGFYSGAILPSDAHPEDIEQLLRKGLIEPIKETN